VIRAGREVWPAKPAVRCRLPDAALPTKAAVGIQSGTVRVANQFAADGPFSRDLVSTFPARLP
jgi:hypothetical protein